MMNKPVATFVVLLWTVAAQAQMFWQRPFVNYNRYEYKAANQNWMIAQHENGWMFFANNKGLLEFDGVYWNLYPVAHQAKMRSIKMGKDGKIYVGGLKEFGCFTPNRYGGLDYHSLSKDLNAHTVSNIWNIHCIGNKVYFQGDHGIFCYDQQRVCAIDCAGVSFSEVVDGRLYFSNIRGLSYLKGEKPVYVAHSDFLRTAGIIAFLPYQGHLMIVTSRQGIFLFDGKTFSRPFPAVDRYLQRYTVSCAAIDGSVLALGTTAAGLLLADLSGQHIESISIENGMQNKSLLSMAFDRDHNLWLGLDNGIGHVSLNSNLFFLNSRFTSIGAGYCSAQYDGRLYFGTNQGIYVSAAPLTVDAPVTPEALADMSGQVHCLYSYDGKLFCGGRKFFAVIDGQQIHRFDERGVWHVQAVSADADIMIVGTYWGLETMRKTGGNWQVANKIAGCKLSAKNMYVEPESGNVWIANRSDGLWRVTLDNRFTKVLRQKCYNTSQMPVGDNVYIASIAGDIVFASRQGLFRYNADKDAIEPDRKLEKRLDGHRAYTYIQQDRFGSIWYVTDGLLKRAGNQDGFKSICFCDNMIEDFEDVYPFSDRQTLVGTEDGFALIDMTRKQATTSLPNLQIRKFYTTNGRDSLVYGQSIGRNDTPVVIRYRDNSVRIEYACNSYDPTQTTLYAYRLQGFEEQWSEYTTNTIKEYTNLPEGDYTFEVRVRDTGKTPITAALSFEILPPWYRTWWAYVLYVALLAGAASYGFHRYKVGRARLIRLKDAELTRQKNVLKRDIDRKNQQIGQLEEEKLRTELNYKSDELTKTTLNVVRKNEILQKIKKDAEGLSRTVSDGNLVNIRRGILRLIAQIDTNIEHDSDLDNFQNAFDAVHSDFFKKLDTLFPQLSFKDKMLCAYIKMNLMSKEIAPLLNISVRGVEISRYRLRKKLGLDEKANLAEYLQKI